MLLPSTKKDSKHILMELIGESMLLASISISYAGCEMSSKFSVRNFSKDEATLQSAADALADYMLIASFWTIGVILLLTAKYGILGFIFGLLSNLLVMSWFYLSYMKAFRKAAKTNNLEMPKFRLFHH